jgi:hypothetical protein
MLNRSRAKYLDLPRDMMPRLMVVIDTEEEFDWSQPLARENTAVTAIRAQDPAQEIFARHGMVPTYVIDYPIVASDEGREVLGAYRRAGVCTIGAHLHPWVSPPHEEAVNPYNSYAGNLPEALERTKLTKLTETIEANFGVRPQVFRAGRWGLGPNTWGILSDLGYLVDTSVVPHTDFGADGGPCYYGFDNRPFWTGAPGGLLEIPQSAGFAGMLAGQGPSLFPRLISPMGMRLRGPGFAARLRLLERIRLTPEGMDLAALRRLTEALIGQGVRFFTLTYHSPTLQPGGTPYVRDQADLMGFLATLDGYLAYFMGALGGRPETPLQIHRDCARDASGAADAAAI